MTTMMKSLPLLLSGFLSACSQQVNVKPYDQYLGMAPAGTMSDVASSTRLQPFVRMFSDLSPTAVSANINEVYAEQLYFHDTFHTFYTRDEVRQYFLNMGAKAVTKVTPLDYAENGDTVWLRWQMSTKFDVLWKKLDITTVGMTHLRFNEAGLIVMHQDYWDGVEGFYAHLPLLGGLVTWVRSGLGE
jgi:hypothetical protein